MMSNDKNKVLICRPWITTKNGKRIYAKNYGKEAFCFYVSKEPND